MPMAWPIVTWEPLWLESRSKPSPPASRPEARESIVFYLPIAGSVHPTKEQEYGWVRSSCSR